jgi:hypothetical protein
MNTHMSWLDRARVAVMVALGVVVTKISTAVFSFCQSHPSIAAPGFLMRLTRRSSGRRGLSVAQRMWGRPKVALLKQLERRLEKVEKMQKRFGVPSFGPAPAELAKICFEQQYGETAEQMLAEMARAAA